MEHEGDGDTNCGGSTWDNPQTIRKGTEKFGNKKTSRDYQDHIIFKIG